MKPITSIVAALALLLLACENNASAPAHSRQPAINQTQGPIPQEVPPGDTVGNAAGLRIISASPTVLYLIDADSVWTGAIRIADDGRLYFYPFDTR